MEERLKKIINYIENYRKYSGKNEIINYYQILDLPKDADKNTLINDIKNKKLKILFHSDLTEYIPNNYKKDFELLSNAVKEMENIFSNQYNKETYDNKLKQQTQTKKISVTDEEIKLFGSIVSENILKHGFNLASVAVKMIVEQNSFKGITRQNESRTKAINLGREKILAILNAFKKQQQNTSGLDSSIINYFSFLVYQEELLMNKMNIYVDACIQTTSKYDVGQLEWAITESLKEENKVSASGEKQPPKYSGFTNNGLVRENLRQNFENPKDLLLLSKMYLNIHKTNEYQNVDISSLSEQQIIGDFANLIGEQLGRQNNHTRFH